MSYWRPGNRNSWTLGIGYSYPLWSKLQLQWHLMPLQYDIPFGIFSIHLPKPDISICVFGILDDEEQAFDDWHLRKG